MNSTGNVDANWGQPFSPEQQQALVEAIAAARKAHPDFEALEAAMASCARALRPDWSRITLPEFVEATYCVVRFSNFCSDVRDHLLLEAANLERASVEALTPASFIEDEIADANREGAGANVADTLPATEQERRQKAFDTFTTAMAEVRQRHHDVDRWLPLMDEVAKGLTRNPSELSPSGYIEVLYLTSKTATFAEPLRAQFLEKAVPEGGEYRM